MKLSKHLSERLFVLFITIVWCSLSTAQQRPINSQVLAKVEGDRIALKAKAMGFGINIEVVLPAGYSQAKHKKYPVIFLMDSQWKLMQFMPTYWVLAYEKRVPECIVVGVSADTSSGPWANNIDQFRAALYTPEKNQPHIASSIGGDAEKLLSFFKAELIPYIEQNYAALPDRTLVGSSLAGLFGLYALLQEDRLFQRYVLNSPSVYWGDDYIQAYETRYFKTGGPLSARVFMGVGEEALAHSVMTFSKKIMGRGYKQLDYQFHTSPLGHVSNELEGNARGLPFVFSDKDSTL